MPDYEILGHEDGFSADPTRQGKLDRFVTFRRPDQTLGFVSLPVETYTVEAAKQAVIKAEAARRLTQPIKFSVP